MKILLPGDLVSPTQDQKIGPGLYPLSNTLIASKAGILHSTDTGLWLDTRQKRYIPSPSESVIGIVISKHQENYRVDLGSAHAGSLGFLAFEGATKRNRPNLEVGSLVYARVSVANKDMEPELECIHPATGKSQGFGHLKDGFMVQVSLKLARALLDPQHPILALSAKSFPFEIAVGLNGRIWINAESPKQIVALAQMIKQADGLLPSKLLPMIKSHLKRLYE